MIVAFETKVKGYFVKLPYNSFDITLKSNIVEYKVPMFNGITEAISLKINDTSSNKEILGFCKDLTTNQIERVVDFWVSVSGDGSKVFENYETGGLPKYKDAQSSFNSLLKSLNILLVNPYSPYSNRTEHSDFIQDAKRYFEARERTGDWLCIIEK